MFFETLFYLVLLHLGRQPALVRISPSGSSLEFLVSSQFIPRASVTLYAYNLQSQDTGIAKCLHIAPASSTA